jgi:helicase MOV-10
VESINQLLKLPPTTSEPIRILAVAPSNAAADLIVERLANLSKLELFRLNAVSRSLNGVPEVVRERSSVAPNNQGFLLKSEQELLKFRVIVSTCMSGSCISAVGVKARSFSHVFVDEAGHATEPEVLATLGGLLTPEKCRLILSGDPMQLGPIIRSKLACKYGLDNSLLERLVTEADLPSSPYHRAAGHGPYPPHLMVKLLHNYRSHPEILTVPNARFYANELIAAADVLERNSLCRWPGWSNGNTTFPSLLHHVKGEEQREGNSPSWFNTTEVLLVLDYVARLLEYRQSGLTVKDIGIITPYAKQAQKLREGARRRGLDVALLKIGSVENFQGDERRVIILSTVRSQLLSFNQFDVKFDLGFVNQPKRLNVAITRAKQALIVVGNAELLETDPNWRALITHCVVKRGIVGEFKSAFDDAGQPIPPEQGDDDLTNIGLVLTADADRRVRDAARADEAANQDSQRNAEAPWRDGDL